MCFNTCSPDAGAALVGEGLCGGSGSPGRWALRMITWSCTLPSSLLPEWLDVRNKLCNQLPWPLGSPYHHHVVPTMKTVSLWTTSQNKQLPPQVASAGVFSQSHRKSYQPNSLSTLNESFFQVCSICFKYFKTWRHPDAKIYCEAPRIQSKRGRSDNMSKAVKTMVGTWKTETADLS